MSTEVDNTRELRDRIIDEFIRNEPARRTDAMWQQSRDTLNLGLTIAIALYGTAFFTVTAVMTIERTPLVAMTAMVGLAAAWLSATLQLWNRAEILQIILYIIAVCAGIGSMMGILQYPAVLP